MSGSSLNRLNRSRLSEGVKPLDTAHSSDMEDVFRSSPVFERFSEQLKFMGNTYDSDPSAYHLVSAKIKESVWKLMNLDSLERSGKVTGRERYGAVLNVIKKSLSSVREDQPKTRLAILEALRLYPKKHGSQAAVTAIGAVFGHEFRRISSEHPYNRAEVAAEALANIHAYPKGPIGVTNAQIFEAQVQDCLTDSTVDVLSSPEMLEDRTHALSMRTKLMDARSESKDTQSHIIDEVVDEFIERLNHLKSQTKPHGFDPDAHTITWQGCLRGGLKDPMGHAYVATFHVVGSEASSEVYMKISDSGTFGRSFFKPKGDDAGSSMMPRIFKFDPEKPEELRALIKEMAESTVVNDRSLVKQSEGLQNAVNAATVSRPKLPPSMHALRQETMKKTSGDYCVSWSHMHNKQAHFAMKGHQMLKHDKAASLVSQMSMIMYRHQLDMSLLKKADHAASSTLRDIVYSAQYSMATEARDLLEQWNALSPDQKEVRPGESQDPVNELIHMTSMFSNEYILTTRHIEGAGGMNNFFTVTRGLEPGANMERQAAPVSVGRTETPFDSSIFPDSTEAAG